MLAAGYTLGDLVPLLPLGAALRPEQSWPDGEVKPALELQPSQFGKTPAYVDPLGEWWGLRAAWNTLDLTEGEARLHDDYGCNAGHKMGISLTAIDADITNPDLMHVVRKALNACRVTTPCRIGREPKALWPFVVDGDPIPHRVIKIEYNGEHHAIEILGVFSTGNPCQAAMLGGHPSGSTYSWEGCLPDMVPLKTALQPIDAPTMSNFADHLRASLEAAGAQTETISAARQGDTSDTSRYGLSAPIELIRIVMDHLPNPGVAIQDGTWTEWKNIGIALWNSTEGSDEGLALWHQFSSGPKYNEAVTNREWRSASRNNGTSGFGTLFNRLKDLGPLPSDVSTAMSKRKADTALANMPPPDPNARPLLETIAEIKSPGGPGLLELTESDICDMSIRNPETIRKAAAYKIAGDPLYDVFLHCASNDLFKTAFEAQVKQYEREFRTEVSRKAAGGKLFVEPCDPNEWLPVAKDIADRIGENRFLFSFMGDPVVIDNMPQTDLRLQGRDSNGVKIAGEYAPVTTTSARPIRSEDVLTATVQAAHFVGTDGDGASPPLPVLQMVRSVVRDHVPPITNIATHPVLWRGEVLFGDKVYHEPSGLYLATGHVEVVPYRDPIIAWHLLRHRWLGDFPFATEADALAAVCCSASLLVGKTDMLTESGPPIFAFTAPSPSIGKSFLQQILHRGVAGVPLPTMVYPERPEEREKMFLSSILGGSSHLAFDNMPNGSTIGNSHNALASLVTQANFSGRKLGVSENKGGYSGLVVSMTGNGLIFEGDMASRTLEIHLALNAGQSLTQRAFQHADLASWTDNNRGHIIGALVCLLGGQTPLHKGCRFDTWNRVVGSPLINATGVVELYDGWLDAGENDAAGIVSENGKDLIRAFARVSGGQKLTGPELTRELSGHASTVLSQVFETVMPKSDEVSRYLKRNKNCTVDGRRLIVSSENLGARTDYKRRPVFQIT